MKWMSSFIVKAQAVDGIHAVKFQFAAVDEIGESADQGLAFQFPFVAGAGWEADQRRAIVAVNNNAEIEAQAMRIPAMDFTFHRSGLVEKGEAKVCQRRCAEATAACPQWLTMLLFFASASVRPQIER